MKLRYQCLTAHGFQEASIKVAPQMPSTFKEFAGHVAPLDESCAAQLQTVHPLKQSELNVSVLDKKNWMLKSR